MHARLQRIGSAPAHAAVAAVLLFFTTQSVQTLFGASGAPLAVGQFYPGSQGEPNRDHMAPIVEYLQEHRRAGEELGVTGLFTPYFELEDRGIPSRLIVGKRREAAPSLPPWILSRIKEVGSGELEALGGPQGYELVVTDTLASLGLFRRRS